MLIAPLLASLLAVAPLQVEAPTHDQLVAQARQLLPAYEGDHKDFLSPTERRHTEAASHLLSAAIALEPQSSYAMWWKGQSEVLLGEDSKNRGDQEAANEHYATALAAYDGGLALAPDYYWAHYARGMANYNLGNYFAAVGDYDRAVARTQAVIDQHGKDQAGDAAFVRFKARQWRADARMHLGQFEEARAEYRAFYADNGNNQWDLGFALGETYLRERDFGAALALYADLVTKEDYANFEGIHSQLGYLAGLLDGNDDAPAHLGRAMDGEFSPTLYPRMWLWILSSGDVRAAAAKDLHEFLDHPPRDLSPWDRTLGRYVLDGGSSADFLAAFEVELERRQTEGIQLDDLPCEVQFYLGLRLELDGLALGPSAERTATLRAALDAYRAALSFHPRAFKWEWAYARLHLANLLNLANTRGDLGVVPASSESPPLPAGTVLERWWHVAGEFGPSRQPERDGTASLLDPIRFGMLERVNWRDGDGKLHSTLHVFDGRS